jgi:hypothetical protein
MAAVFRSLSVLATRKCKFLLCVKYLNADVESVMLCCIQ